MAATTPEMPNEKPEEQIGKGDSVANSMRADVQGVDLTDLNNIFANQDKDSANAVFGDLALSGSDSSTTASGDATTANSVVNAALNDGAGATDPRVREALDTYRDIAKLTTTNELEQALSMQRDTIVAMENRVNGQQNVLELGDDKQQADNLLNANTYLANFA